MGSGLIAGLIAGLILGLLTIAFIAPLVILSEEFESDPETAAGFPVNQRNVFTVIGTIVLGTVYGLILSAVFNLTGRRGRKRFALRGLGFGLLAYLIVSFIPSLAFPPNPPGVEAQASVAVRQGWWLGIIGFEVAGLFAYALTFRHLRTRGKTRARLAGLAAFAGTTSIPFLVGPANKLGEVLVPAQLILDFQLASSAVFLIFWLTLGSLVGWFSGWLGRELDVSPLA